MPMPTLEEILLVHPTTQHGAEVTAKWQPYPGWRFRVDEEAGLLYHEPIPGLWRLMTRFWQAVRG